MDIANLNWTAVLVGAIAAFVLGMIWFSPKMFGKSWAVGSHNIAPPPSPPILAMVLMFAGLFLLAFVVGMTETVGGLGTAIAAILAVAAVVAGTDLFSQKSGAATLIDAGYNVAAGAIMIAAQAIF